MKNSNQKIQVQAVLIFAGFFIIASLILFLILQSQTKNDLNEKFNYKASVFLSYFAVNRENLLNGKLQDREKLEQLAAANHAKYIVLADQKGRVKDAINFKEAKLNKFNLVSDDPESINGNVVFKLYLPIKLNDITLGKIYIGFGAAEETNELNKKLMQSALLSLLISLSGIIFTYYLASIFFRPLKKIIKALDESSNSEIEPQINVHASNELGVLAEKISEVILQKNSSINENKKLRRELSETFREKLNELGREMQIRKSAEESLVISEKRFKLLFNNAPIPMISVDISGRVINVNSAFNKLFGLGSESIAQMPISSFFPDKIFSNFDDIWEVNKAIELKRHFSFTNISSHQSEFIFKSFLIEEKNNPAELIIQVMDISDLKRIQSDLIIALEKSNASEKLKDAFLAQMSHEIRTPLNVILNSIPLLIDEISQNDEDILIILNSVKSAGKRLQRTIDMILSMSAVQSGNYDPTFTKFNLTEDLQVLVNEMTSLAMEKNLKLTYEFNEEKVFIEADRYTVSQIFQNLLNNAIKYSSKGEVTVKLFNSETNCRVDVIDQGVGISDEFKSQMFTPFTQEKVGHKREYEGNGLGLALVKKYAELNNLGIEVHSEKNEGSVFSIIFKQGTDVPTAEEKLDLIESL